MELSTQGKDLITQLDDVLSKVSENKLTLDSVSKGYSNLARLKLAYATTDAGVFSEVDELTVRKSISTIESVLSGSLGKFDSFDGLQAIVDKLKNARILALGATPSSARHERDCAQQILDSEDTASLADEDLERIRLEFKRTDEFLSRISV